MNEHKKSGKSLNKYILFMAICAGLIIATWCLKTVYVNHTLARNSKQVNVMNLEEDGNYEGLIIDHSLYKSIYVIEDNGTYAVVEAKEMPVAAIPILTPSYFTKTGTAYRCVCHGEDDSIELLHTYIDKDSFMNHYDKEHKNSLICMEIFHWLLVFFAIMFLIDLILWLYRIIKRGLK